MWAVGIFILGTVLACLTSGRWVLSGEMNIINALASFEDKQVGDFVNPNTFITWYRAIRAAFSWDYPFLSSPWAFFIKVPLWLVSLGVLWALIELGKSLVQGAITGIKSILT
jgi:hypothetical protein